MTPVQVKELGPDPHPPTLELEKGGARIRDMRQHLQTSINDVRTRRVLEPAEYTARLHASDITAAPVNFLDLQGCKQNAVSAKDPANELLRVIVVGNKSFDRDYNMDEPARWSS